MIPVPGRRWHANVLTLVHTSCLHRHIKHNVSSLVLSLFLLLTVKCRSVQQKRKSPDGGSGQNSTKEIFERRAMEHIRYTSDTVLDRKTHLEQATVPSVLARGD